MFFRYKDFVKVNSEYCATIRKRFNENNEKFEIVFEMIGTDEVAWIFENEEDRNYVFILVDQKPGDRFLDQIIQDLKPIMDLAIDQLKRATDQFNQMPKEWNEEDHPGDVLQPIWEVHREYTDEISGPRWEILRLNQKFLIPGDESSPIYRGTFLDADRIMKDFAKENKLHLYTVRKSPFV